MRADGNGAAGNAQVLGELLGLVDAGDLDVPIAQTFPLEQVRDAYRYMEGKRERGKVVLVAGAGRSAARASCA